MLQKTFNFLFIKLSIHQSEHNCFHLTRIMFLQQISMFVTLKMLNVDAAFTILNNNDFIILQFFIK